MGTNKTGKQRGAVPLTQDLLEPAADLFVTNYEQARAVQPLLPSHHADRAGILGLLTDLAAREEGVAVMHGDRLVGYGMGMGGGSWNGWPPVFMPEWGHATVPEERRAIHRTLYGALSRQWAGKGWLCHLACMPSAGAALDEWQWMGFGLQCVDALRDLRPASGDSAPCAVRRAGPADTAVVADMMTALRRHMADGPVFLPDHGPANADEVREQLADRARACFVAYDGARPVGYMTVRSANPDACWLIQDSGTASIDGAYMLPECRGRGIATALLDAAIAWARECGYVRLAVDFEAHNAPARAFWLRHFEPVTYSVARYIRHPDSGGAQ